LEREFKVMSTLTEIVIVTGVHSRNYPARGKAQRGPLPRQRHHEVERAQRVHWREYILAPPAECSLRNNSDFINGGVHQDMGTPVSIDPGDRDSMSLRARWSAVLLRRECA
jgi:hypothetical protein